LSNKAAQADYERAQNQKQMSEARRAVTAQKIALDVRNAHSSVAMNRARIEAAEKSLEFAQRRLTAEEKKNQLGVSSIRFLLDEQRNVTAAEMSSLEALINYAKALVDYDRAIGRTLRRHNVEIDKEIQIAGRPQTRTTRAGN
jgi:outer membrane protein